MKTHQPDPAELSAWDRVPCPLWIGTAAGVCVFANQALYRHLRLCPEQVLGTLWQTLLPSADKELALLRLATQARRRTRFRNRVSIETRGRLRLLEARSETIGPAEGDDTLLLISLKEVELPTARLQSGGLVAETLRLCFDHAPIGIGFLNLKLRFVHANPALAKQLTGVKSQIEGDSLSKVLHGRLPSASICEVERICTETVSTGNPHALHGWALGGGSATESARITDWEIRRIQTTEQVPVGVLLAVSEVTQQKLVEERLRLLASILESTPDFVAVLSLEGRVLYLNKSAREVAQMRTEQPLQDLHITDLHPDWAARLVQEEGLPTALRAGIWEGETLFRRAGGDPVPVSQILCAHRNGSGQVEFLSTTLRDITEATEVRTQLAQAHGSLEQRVQERTSELATATALIRGQALRQTAVADLSEMALSGCPLLQLLHESARAVKDILQVDYTIIRELSSETEELQLRVAEGWTGGPISQAIPCNRESPCGRAVLEKEPLMFPDLEGDSTLHCEKELMRAGCVSAMAASISLGTASFGALAVYTLRRRDFSDTDVQFIQAVANIIATSVQRQKAEAGIARSREQAEAANLAKSAFLSRMSHELRTPLNAILGFAQLLKMEEPTPGQLESIGHIHRAGRHLLSLINEVLEVSHIESGRLALTLEPLELNRFLSNCVELMRPIACSGGIDLQFISREKPFHVRADRQRLNQVVLNFLSNAIKYNNEGGMVLVSLRQTTASARFEIRDTGPGISLEKRTQLFKPFERLGAETTNIEGMGIGLALCKGLLEAMGGSIGLESPDGGGCVFWAELPLADPADIPQLRIERLPKELVPGSPDAGVPTAKILAVDSHDLDLQLLEQLLHRKQAEAELLSAMQGDIGLELAREHQPSLILLDADLPDMSAEDFLTKLRSIFSLKRTPVVLFGIDSDTPKMRRLSEVFETHLLLKPYAPEDLLSLMRSLLKSSR